MVSTQTNHNIDASAKIYTIYAYHLHIYKYIQLHTYVYSTYIHYITLHDITLHCIALHCITLHYITTQYNAINYNTIQNIHYIHPYIHPSIHPCMHPCTLASMHPCMHACMQAYIHHHTYITIHHHTSPYITIHRHASPLHHHYIIITSPLHHHYITITSPLHHHYITITLHYNTLHYVHTYTFNHINVTLHCIVLDFDMTVHSMCCSTFLHYNTKQCMKVYSYLKNMPMNKAGNKLVKRSNRSMRQCICKGNERRHEAHKDARLGVNNHSIQEQTTTTYNYIQFPSIRCNYQSRSSHTAVVQKSCTSLPYNSFNILSPAASTLHPLCTLPPKPGPSILSVLCTFRRLLSYLPPN